MFEFFPFPLFTGVGLLVIWMFLLRRKHSLGYLVCFAIFCVYLLGVLGVTLFPIPLPASIGERTPVTTILARVNLVPFNFGDLFDNHPNVIFQEIVGNIVLAMPFGFGIPFLVSFKTKHYPWLAVGAGFAVEIAQLGMNLLLGGNFRSVDINDVLLNATGALLGYTLFRGFAWVVVLVSNRFKVRQRGLKNLPQMNTDEDDKNWMNRM